VTGTASGRGWCYRLWRRFRCRYHSLDVRRVPSTGRGRFHLYADWKCVRWGGHAGPHRSAELTLPGSSFVPVAHWHGPARTAHRR
jgi:hypothetical protein